MVSSVYKWLSIFLMGYFLSAKTFNQIENSRTLFGGAGGLHPLHVSTTEINHNATDKTLEISCRIFTDDFEASLSKQYNTKANLSLATLKAQMDSLIKKYISSHLHLKVDDKSTALNYIGFENEDQATYAYLEVENVATVKKVDIDVSLLHDLYTDQIEIVHVIVNGSRKSTKLDYPAKQALFNF